jgi:hypothetical protein
MSHQRLTWGFFVLFCFILFCFVFPEGLSIFFSSIFIIWNHCFEKGK